MCQRIFFIFMPVYVPLFETLIGQCYDRTDLTGSPNAVDVLIGQTTVLGQEVQNLLTLLDNLTTQPPRLSKTVTTTHSKHFSTTMRKHTGLNQWKQAVTNVVFYTHSTTTILQIFWKHIEKGPFFTL